MLFSLAAHSPIVSWPRLPPQRLPLKLFGTAPDVKNIFIGASRTFNHQIHMPVVTCILSRVENEVVRMIAKIYA
jgi:hypothetical protein